MTVASTVRCVKAASAEPHDGPDSRSFACIKVQLRERCDHSLRTVAHRLYIDLVVVTSTPTAAVGNERSAPAIVAQTASDKLPETYEELHADILRRAPLLSAQADVMGLLALVAELHRKDQQLERRRPDVVAELTGEINRRLEEAGLSQPERDRNRLRKAKEQ